MRDSRRALVAIATAAVVLAAGACGSDPDASTEPTIDLSQLDVGNLRTKPREFGTVTSLDQARGVEAMRLGNYVPLPLEIDPNAIYPPTASSIVRIFTDLSSLAVAARTDADASHLPEIAPGLVAGFVSTARIDPVPTISTELDNVVMMFSDDQAAATAAGTMAQADRESNTQQETVQIPKYPTAHAHYSTELSGQIRSWYATGRFVILTYIFDSVMSELETRDLPKLIGRIEKSIEVIAPRIAQFPATPTDQLLNLHVDDSGMLGMVLPTLNIDTAQPGVPGVYDGYGGLHITPDPGADKELFKTAGVDRVAWSGSYLYRADSPESAKTIVREHSNMGKFFQTTESPKNLPIAQCKKYIGPYPNTLKYYCFVSHGRYAAQVTAGQLADAHQRISAQYAILANSDQ